VDYIAESQCDRAKAVWRTRHKWRTPPPEASATLADIDARAADRLVGVAEDDPDAPLFVGIDSVGGNPIEALRIYNAFRQRPAPVHCHVAGRCNSSAILALLGADHRTANPSAQFVIHAVAWEVAPTGRVTAHALRQSAAELADMDEELTSIICFRSRVPRWQMLNALAHDMALDANEAWLKGLITRIVG
jgi:ATP-dependent protease ClpP protease subunit